MNATIIARSPTSFTLQVEVPYNDSMLDFEEAPQHRLNEAGVVATAEGLRQFDTDGAPITVGPVKFTTRGRVEKDYQTPYGVATRARHVDQSPQGGPTYCPLDRGARIVVSSTPRFAKMISHKDAEFSSPRVQIDLEENHGRVVSRCLIQDVADAVAAAALAKEEDWSDTLPKFEAPPATVAIGLDGTCALMCEDGWREAMVGTLAFSDRDGERRHTVYLAATPEYGKGEVPEPPGGGDRACEGEVPRRPLRGDRRWGRWELGVPGPTHRGAGGGLLACGGVPGEGGGGGVPGPPPHQGGVAGRCLPSAEARAGRGRVGAEAVAKAGPGTPLGQGGRGGAAGDHLLCEPVGDGADGLRQPGGGERADRQRGDGGGVQGNRQAAAVRLGDEVDRGWCGGGAEPAGPERHAGAMGPVLVEGGPVGVPGRRLSQDQSGFTSKIGRTQ